VTNATQHATKTVLIADDEPALRILARAVVASDEYEVVQAADGDEAWALIQQHRPAVALLDVQMPGRTGLELTRAIKGTPELAATEVILLTAKTQAADVAAGLAAGADRYLSKPFSPRELRDAVKQVVRTA